MILTLPYGNYFIAIIPSNSTGVGTTAYAQFTVEALPAPTTITVKPTNYLGEIIPISWTTMVNIYQFWVQFANENYYKGYRVSGLSNVFDPLPVGNYMVSVQSVDSSGFYGSASRL